MGIHIIVVEDWRELRKLLRHVRKGNLTLINAVLVVVCKSKVVGGIARQYRVHVARYPNGLLVLPAIRDKNADD